MIVYHSMSKVEKAKWDKKLREFHIVWQMCLGWDNPNLDKYNKQFFAKKKHISEYPQNICTNVWVLDGFEGWRKKTKYF